MRIISDGQISSGILLENDTMHVSSGGTARDTSINSDGVLCIFEGGVASETSANNLGNLFIYSGGTAIDSLLNSGCYCQAASGGTAISTVIKSEGFLEVASGGMALNTEINKFGLLFVTGGGIASGVTVNFSGEIDLIGGGSANEVTFNPGGRLYMDSGSIMTNIIENGGYVWYDEGAILTFLPNTFSYLALIEDWATVHSGTTATDTTINMQGYFYVSNGGSAVRTRVTSGGSIVVCSGGFASETVLSSCGLIWVASGGTAADITAYQGAEYSFAVAPNTYIQGTFNGSAFIMEDAHIEGLAVYSNGSVFISSGGTASGTTLNTQASLSVESGGTAIDTAINAGSYLYIYDGGLIDGVAIGESGNLYAFGGGTITGRLTIAPNAIVTTYSGAVINFDLTSVTPGDSAIVSNWARIIQKEDAEYTVTIPSSLQNGQYILADAADDFEKSVTVFIGDSEGISLALGDFFLYDSLYYTFSRNIAGSLLLSVSDKEPDREKPVVSISAFPTDAMTNAVTITAICTDNESVALRQYSFDATSWIDFDGTLIVSDNCVVYVRAQDTARNISDIASCTISNIDKPRTITNETFLVSSGMIANSTTVNSAGYLRILSGGTALMPAINNDGFLYVSKGGLAISARINNQGEFHILNGGAAANTVITSGANVYASSGALLNAVIVAGGTLDIAEGAIVANIAENGGYVSVSSGAAVSFYPHSFSGAILNSANATLHSGTTAFAPRLDSFGYLYIYEGGLAVSAVVNSGGNLHISSGGTATDASVNSYGYIRVMNGGSVTNTLVRTSGYLYVSSGGTAANTSAAGGIILLSSGGYANNISVTSDGFLYVLNTASACDATVDAHGSMSILRGGIAYRTSVLADGGLVISSGGTAYDTRIASGGNLNIIKGGKLTGDFRIAPGAIVTLNSTAKIDFAPVIPQSSGTAMIGNWAAIQGGTNAEYSLTVSSTPAFGIYLLAEGASGFSQSMNLTVGGENAGTLSPDDSLQLNGRKYTLDLNNGALRFTIAPDNPDDVLCVDILSGSSVKGNVYVTGSTATLTDDVVGGTIFGPPVAETPINRQIAITGTTSKRFIAGGELYSIEQLGSNSLVALDISDSIFDSGIFGGPEVLDSTVNADVRISAEDSSANIIFAGANLKAGTAENPNITVINGSCELNMENVISTNYLAGSSLITNHCSETRYGNITINVDGGTHRQIVGGSLIQCKNGDNLSSEIIGDISISLEGPLQATSVYGGSVALYNGCTRNESITGNIAITFDMSAGGIITDAIVGGGAGYCTVNGNTSITIIGSGNGKDFLGTTTILGDSANATWGHPYVSGSRTLSFTNFSGTVTSRIFRFDSFSIDAASSLNLMYIPSELAQKNWDIASDSPDRISVNLPSFSDKAVYNLDLSGSELNFTCELASDDEWTIFKAAGDSMDNRIFAGLENAASIILNGDELTQSDEFLFEGSEYRLEYRFSEEDDTTYGMLVASKLT